MSMLTLQQEGYLGSLPDEEFDAVMMMTWPQAARYADMRMAGESHRMAEVLAARKFPGVRTDVEFNRGRCNGNQFESVPGLGDHLKRLAEAEGVSTTGKYYCHGLAEYPGDPEAWVSGRGDVLAVARKKGMKVSGMVEYQPEERAPMRDVEVAEDLVEAEVEEVMSMGGGYRRADVSERVRELRSGRVDPNPLCVNEVA